ncbi:NAD(P)-binding domain-containing protein [Corynebacterium auriscanis]|uniref:NAD(P)-binding domain-containing protein n=1 Tax=Corynebacterium auriscanis TaxID=99807 RepID=UPI00224649C3|nr:NAD(P)-binding domain-containing protein [Corynebacterium auriscanis]MCX2164077.1 NAD(P)/FAD-dependent oxidoreductase [Corynebacterium auriscanis]
MESTPHIYPALVIGGGQSGLATAYYLRRFGIEYLILDDQDKPGGAWLHVWPTMTLFSNAASSNLPGKPMPGYPGFPPASHVIDYLAEYERRYGLNVERSVTVTDVEFLPVGTLAETSDRPTYVVTASDGRRWYAHNIVAATGTWSQPFIPTLPGSYAGQQWHSANYPGPVPFQGASVAVVGAANSGAQIAGDLVADPNVGPVTWFTRHEPRWMPDDVDGRVLFRRSRERLLAIQRGEPDPGPDSQLGDIVALPHLQRLRDAGDLYSTPMFSSLNELSTDHLIWCTGFRPALRPFRHVLSGRDPLHKGFYFVGYGNWVGPGAATITGVAPFARQAAQAIKNA